MADNNPWSQDQINGWYNQYLGHDAGSGWQSWSDHPDAQSAIQNSAEGQAYARSQAHPAGAPTWGNNGGTPQTDPWQNYAPAPPQPGPSAPATGAQPTALANQDPGAATSAPGSYNSAPPDPKVAGMIDSWIKSNNLQANQSDPNALHSIVQHLRQNGVDAQVDYQDSNGHTGGILVNGQPYQLINGSNQWTPLQAWKDSGAGGSGSTWSGGIGGGAGSSSMSASSTTNPQMAAQRQTLMDILMKRAQQSLSIDPTTDPVIRPQVDNAAAEGERERRDYLNNLAESSNPYATGSLNTTATQTAEKAGQSRSNLQSQLVSNELTQRRSEIQNALSQMGSLLTSDQQMAMQRELAQIDASLRQQQINSGNDQFMSSLGLQAENQNNYWDAIRSGLL